VLHELLSTPAFLRKQTVACTSTSIKRSVDFNLILSRPLMEAQGGCAVSLQGNATGSADQQYSPPSNLLSFAVEGL
jgi:hypothetical protein